MMAKRPSLLLILLVSLHVDALQNLIPKLNLPFAAPPGASSQNNALEEQLLQAIQNQDQRLSNSKEIERLIQSLEQAQGIAEPAISPSIYGKWRLLFTSNVNTSSPIQRKAVDAKKFPIYQDIVLKEENTLVVSQVVQFSDQARLNVDALASTAAYPLPELTERQGEGRILGFNILGVSLVGDDAKPNPDRPNSRIDFVFDEGQFDFGGVTVPYPVPFRLPILRDTVKGWIDVTYLSERMRISRGNKGTTFVLVKEED